jgi:hypothetical protein
MPGGGHSPPGNANPPMHDFRKDSRQMRKLGAEIVTLLCLVAIAGCTTNHSIANVTTSPGKLVVSVGTINDNAGTLGIGGVTLNVVSSFRNILGNSAYENPGFFSLDGPGGNIIPSTPGNPCDQLFSYGEFPGCQGDVNFASLLGEPPAYNPPSAVGGYSLGFIQTGAPLTNGSYTLSTVVPVNGQNVSFSASASLTSIQLANATGATGFVSDGLGGGTFTIGNPAKPHGKKVHHSGFPAVTEYLIVVENLLLSSSAGTIVATVETNNTTATIVGTGDCASSAGGNPIPCGPNTVYVIDADYPLVEAGPPASHAVAPTLTGAGGQSDISVSGFLPINE